MCEMSLANFVIGATFTYKQKIKKYEVAQLFNYSYRWHTKDILSK